MQTNSTDPYYEEMQDKFFQRTMENFDEWSVDNIGWLLADRDRFDISWEMYNIVMGTIFELIWESFLDWIRDTGHTEIPQEEMQQKVSRSASELMEEFPPMYPVSDDCIGFLWGDTDIMNSCCECLKCAVDPETCLPVTSPLDCPIVNCPVGAFMPPCLPEDYCGYLPWKE